jgi:hypothetical protein
LNNLIICEIKKNYNNNSSFYADRAKKVLILLSDNRILYFYGSICFTLKQLNELNKKEMVADAPSSICLSSMQPGTTNQRQFEGQGLHNRLTPEEKTEGWTLLFDGRSTDGWRGFKTQTPPEGWIVEEGNLIATGKGQ